MPTALYRRYRPDTFDEVIGQDHVTGPLKAALSNQRVNHAYLFSGPRGCGKTTSARILARCLNCAQGPTANPCGECESCRDLATGGPGSLDVVEIDAASHNGVDDARDLRERAVYAPARDRYKVFILDEAHMVTPQGFNALLKLVEEPPEHVKFVFATTEPEKVIGTIRSRTHHYPFRLVPPEIMTNYLEELCEREDVPVGKGVLPLVVRAGGGSVRDSLSVLDQLMAGAGSQGIDYPTAVALLGYTPESLLGDIVDAFSAGDGAAVYRVVDRVIESGQDPRRFVEDLLERFRDLIVVGTAPDQAAALLPEAPGDHVERLAQQAQTMGPAELSRAADLLNAGLTEMTGATSPRLQLELMCARILLPSVDDARRGVLSRLDRMERRVGMSAAGAVPGAVPLASEQETGTTHADQDSRPRGTESAQAGGSGEPRAAEAQAGSAATSSDAPARHYDEDLDAMADFAASAESMLDEEASAPAGQSDGRGGAEQQRRQAAGQSAQQKAPSDTAPAHAAPTNGAPASTAPNAAPSTPAATNTAQTHQRPASTAQGDGTEPSAAPAPSERDQPSSTQSSHTKPSNTEPAAAAAPTEEASGGRAEQPESAEHAAPSQEIDAIRRAWPNILDALGQRSKLARAIVSSNAVPQAFVDGALLLGFNNDSSAAGFNRNANDHKLAEALDEVLGIRATVRVGDVGHGIEIPQGSAQSAPAQRREPRRPSQEEFDAVVGKRAQDQETVDRDRYWQAPPESGPFSDNADGDDDAEGDRRPDEDVGPLAATSGARGTDRTAQYESDEPGSSEYPAGSQPQDQSQLQPQARSEGQAQDETQGSAGFGVPEDTEAAHEDMPRAPEDFEGRYPLQDQDGPAGRGDSDPAVDATPNDLPTRDFAGEDWDEDDDTAAFQDARDADSAQPASTAAGWGAVDMPGVIVPPPADIDEPFGDEPSDIAESSDLAEPSNRAEPSDDAEPNAPAGPNDFAGPADADVRTEGAEHGERIVRGGATDGQPGTPGTRVDDEQSTAQAAGAAEPSADFDDLDFLGAYADPTIAFTENEGYAPPAPAPQRSVADGIAARRAAQADRPRQPQDTSAAEGPSSGSGAHDRNDESVPHVADPAENYVDYDTADDPEIAEAPEFGVPVVERLLGGQVLEEYEE